MKVSIISPIVFNSSSVVDSAFTLDDLITGVSPNCRVVDISKGLEVKSGIDVYEYQGGTISIPTYDENAVYNVGDIVLYNCKLHKITATTATTRPKEPEEYAGWDDIANFENATQRYFRISNTHIADKSMGVLGTNKSRWYYIFFENRPHHPNCGYRFSAKDLNKTGVRNASWYKRQCLSGATSYGFDVSKDYKAVVTNWGAPGMVKLPTLTCKNLIMRGDYSYMRTHLDLPVEYVASPTTYTLAEITTPMDIDGFILKRKISSLSPFDGKNYTNATTYPENGKEEFTFYNSEDFDCIALGRVIADTIDVIITDKNGGVLFSLKGYPVYNTLTKKRFEEAVTGIIYTDTTITSEALIKITLNGNYISIGDIVVGDTLDMGFTNLQFNNDYKDFSPKEQDQWGNVYYKDGVRVINYSGTVDLPIKDYDLLYREMNKIGGTEVIINGSDSINNTPTNSISIFQSSMMIARFKSIKLSTKAKDNKIDDIASYSFAIEERV